MEKRLLGLSGVFAVRKPKGETSAQTLNRLKAALLRAAGVAHPRRQLLRALKLGHGGTLDPMATGVLVVGLNGGCRELGAFLAGSKRYRAHGRFGTLYDTLDCTGTVTHVDPNWAACLPAPRARALIEAQLLAMTGPAVPQRPPAFSAVHVDGQRAHQRARDANAQHGAPAGREADFELPARPVAIHRIALLDAALPDFELDVECGGGCYVRAIIRDLAAALGTVAHMTQLERTQQGALFTLDHALPEPEWASLDRIEQAIKDAQLRRQ